MTRSEVWRLDGQQAHLSVGELSATISPTQPGLGLHAIRWQDAPLVDARLLAIQFAGDDESRELVIADSFVRGNDLVVTYVQTTSRPVRLQVYWRAYQEEVAGKNALGLDLQVSVQTSLLASRPALSISSRVPRSAAWQAVINRDKASVAPRAAEHGADCFRCTFPGATYVEMVHPADVEREKVSACDTGSELSHELFAQSLEKGVILRARARGLFVATAEYESSLVRSIYEQFILAPLPLTT